MTMSTHFSFSATSGLSGQLSDHLGKFVVLFFYPKDNTPGCTSESKDFAMLYDQFQANNAVVYGVSKDTLSSHERFKEKFSMPFELISDTDTSICQQFDVLKEKSMFGKRYMGIERSTFLICPEGKLLHSWRKVKVAGHAEAVLKHIVACQHG